MKQNSQTFINYTTKTVTVTIKQPIIIFDFAIDAAVAPKIIIPTKEHVLGCFFEPNNKPCLYFCRFINSIRVFHYNVLASSAGIPEIHNKNYRAPDFYDTVHRLFIRYYQTHETE